MFVLLAKASFYCPHATVRVVAIVRNETGVVRSDCERLKGARVSGRTREPKELWMILVVQRTLNSSNVT